jgi:streptogramin lyase
MLPRSDRPPLRQGSRLSTLFGVTLVCGVLACSATTSPTNNNGSGGGKTTGSLTVTVTAPSGVTPSVTVTGPSSYFKTLTATTTLSSLPAGSYIITAGTGQTADPIVSIGYSGRVTGSPATVSANGTASSTVAYSEPWTSSGLLWVASAGGYSVTGFNASELAASGAPAPAVSVGNGKSNSVIQGSSAVAVDPVGGIWATYDADTLYYFAPSQLTTSSNAAPHLKLISTVMSEPSAMTFDAKGDLWIGDQGVGKVFEFTPSQLASGGIVTPVVTVSSALGSISRPFSISFDTHGNLWLADYGDSSVLAFTPSQLAASGSPVPTLGIINATATTNCISLAFDANGDIWVFNLTDTLAEYTPSQLTSLGSPTPSVVIVEPHIEEPGPMAFDNSGALWVADVQRSQLLRFVPSELTTSGSPAATVTISADSTSQGGWSMALPYGIAFAPHAAGLPPN